MSALSLLDVRDRHGLTQVVIEDDGFARACERLRSEFVIAILGQVERRWDATVNKDLPTGRSKYARPKCESSTRPDAAFLDRETRNVSERPSYGPAISTCVGQSCSTTSECGRRR